MYMYCKGLLLQYIYFDIKNKQKTIINSDETLQEKTALILSLKIHTFKIQLDQKDKNRVINKIS